MKRREIYIYDIEQKLYFIEKYSRENDVVWSCSDKIKFSAVYERKMSVISIEEKTLVLQKVDS